MLDFYRALPDVSQSCRHRTLLAPYPSTLLLSKQLLVCILQRAGTAIPVALEHGKQEKEQDFEFPFHTHPRVHRGQNESKSYQKKAKKYS